MATVAIWKNNDIPDTDVAPDMTDIGDMYAMVENGIKAAWKIQCDI